MARQVLGVVGAVIGGAFGGAAGAQWGWAIGSMVGGALDPQIIKGPSIGDIAQQTSQEGVPIPIVFGMSPPIAGNIIASSAPRIVKSRKSQGKGGPKVETESVYRTYAIGLCEGPTSGFRRVWRNGILVYDASEGSTLDNTPFLDKARFFLGDYDQDPSPDLEAIYGVGTTPAHRGLVYMVMADDDLTDLRGAIPQYVFQVSGAIKSVVIYDTPGTYTYEKPDGLESAKITVIGGGGGGGGGAGMAGNGHPGSGGGGGGGGFSKDTYTAAELDESTTVTVGACGPGGPGGDDDAGTGVNGEDGSDGTSSSFGDLLTAEGGKGAGPGSADIYTGGGGPGGAGGVGSTENGGAGGDGDTSNGITGGESGEDGDSTIEAPAGGGGGGVLDTFSTPGGTGRGGSVTNTENADIVAGGIAGVSLTSASGATGVLGGPGGDSTDHPYTGGAGGGGGGAGGGNWGGVNGPGIGADGGRGGRYGGGGGGGGAAQGRVDTTPSAIAHAGDGADGGDGVVIIEQTFAAVSIPLAAVITAICNRAGMTQIDTSQIEGNVHGFAITNSYPAYSSLAALSEIFFFDSSNYDGVLHFIPRGGNSVATITEDDMLDDDEDIEQQKRSDSISIPRILNLNYYDIDGGLNTDKQTSERPGDRRSLGDMSLQTAVLLMADEAAQAVVKNHKVLIEDQKGELRFSLPDNWLKLIAAAPIVVQWQGRSERVRITQIETQDGYQSYTCLRDRQSAYTSDVEGIPAAPQTAPPSSVVGPTLIEPLDIPLLRDADDATGLSYYLAISGMLAAWQGALVELSYDGGANYVDSATTRSGAIMGETTTTLADHPQEFPDEVNTVTVRIDTQDAELEATDLAGLLNRQNLAIIGNELMQFASVNEISPGTWELSYLLRGRKGSLPQLHAIGSRFVLLDRGVLAFVPASTADIGRTLTFRATSFGSRTDTGTVTGMVYSGESQTEFRPGYVAARRDGTDAIVSWQGVGRIGGGSSVAHAARFSGYRVTFDDGSTETIVETSEQELVHDVSGLGSPIAIRVEQINEFTDAGPYIEVSLT